MLCDGRAPMTTSLHLLAYIDTTVQAKGSITHVTSKQILPLGFVEQCLLWLYAGLFTSAAGVI